MPNLSFELDAGDIAEEVSLTDGDFEMRSASEEKSTAFISRSAKDTFAILKRGSDSRAPLIGPRRDLRGALRDARDWIGSADGRPASSNARKSVLGGLGLGISGSDLPACWPP